MRSLGSLQAKIGVDGVGGDSLTLDFEAVSCSSQEIQLIKKRSGVIALEATLQ